MDSLPKQQVKKEEVKKQLPSNVNKVNKQPIKTQPKVLPKEELKVSEEAKFDSMPIKVALRPEDS